MGVGGILLSKQASKQGITLPIFIYKGNGIQIKNIIEGIFCPCFDGWNMPFCACKSRKR